MNAKTKIAESVKGTSQLVRPCFAAGMLLQDEDLTQAVDYLRELSRLMFRSLFGCGVICGLEVDVREKCGKVRVSIDRGIALDCFGDPVQVRATQTIDLDPSCGKPLPESLCVVVRRTEKCCAPRPAVCADDDEGGAVATRIVDGFEIRVLSECPECACGCPASVPEPEPSPEPRDEEPPVLLARSGAQARKTQAAQAMQASQTTPPVHDCGCVDPRHPCYADHYAGKCQCCESEWIVLARLCLDHDGECTTWLVDHSVRRFVRPVLMRDPLPARRCRPAVES